MDVIDLHTSVVQEILMRLDPKSLFRFLFANNALRVSVSNEAFWTRYCFAHWGDLFWQLAALRNKQTCKPFVSMYHELARLAEFEHIWLAHYQKPITLADYLKIWTSQVVC